MRLLQRLLFFVSILFGLGAVPAAWGQGFLRLTQRMALAVLLLVSINQVTAQNILAWEMSPQSGSQVASNSTFSATGVGIGVLSRGAGVTATTQSGAINSTGWFSSSSATISDAITADRYYQFTVPVSATATISAVKLILRSSNTGPNTAQLRSSANNYATSLGTTTVTTNNALITLTFPSPLTVSTSTLTFRLYGYGSAANSGSTAGSGGTFRIGASTVASDNDIEVVGTISGIPTLNAAPTTLTFFGLPATPSPSQTYTLSAGELAAPIGILAPTGVEVSTALAGTYGGTLSLPASTSSAVIYARLSSTATGTVSGTITNVSGSVSANVGVSGVVSSIRITEYTYGPPTGTGEFVEITNVGTTPVDLTGWSFDDNSRASGSFSLSAIGILQPQESAVITESVAATFRTVWGISSTIKVAEGNTNNLGRVDEINIYDASNALVDRLTYDDQTLGGPRTQGVTAWIPRASLGTNTPANSISSVIGDAQNSYSATTGNVGNPGMYYPALIAIPTALTNFSTTTGTPSAEQTYVFSTTSVTTSSTLTASAGVEISTTSGSGFASTLTIPVGTSSATIYARLAATAPLANPFSGTITNVNRSFTATVVISGTIGAATAPVVTISPISITNQTTLVGTHSVAQTFTVTTGGGSGPVTATATSGVEISSDNATFSTTATLTASTSGVSLYVRLMGTSEGPVSATINVEFGPASASAIVSGTVTTQPPSISVAASTTVYLSASAVSGVINDPTDPAATLGVSFTINDTDTPVDNLSVTVSSSNISVVPTANLNLIGTGATRILRITPTGVGYSTIVVTVSDGSGTASYTISYAASASSTSTSRFHTGAADASTAIDAGGNHMFVADDESQLIRLYDRANSGLFLNSFDYNTSLAVAVSDPEVDIESSVLVGSRIYWLGSHSNSANAGNPRPNRYRFFATDLSGTGAAATLTYVGRYDGLRTDLIAWDVNNTHGLGANYLGLQASAATGVIPEATGGNGFNIEGLTTSPDNSAAYVAFRAPISPASARTKALIVPVTNFASLVSGNPTTGPATFGAPILLDLGGRGIREIKKNAANQYLIVAGSASGFGAPPNDFRLYTWTGVATDAPVLRAADLSGLSSTTSSIESIVEMPTSLADNSSIQFLMDNGDAVYYNDGIIAKDLTQNNFKKFRSDYTTLGAALIPTLTANSTTLGNFTTLTGIASSPQVYTLTGNDLTASVSVSAPAGFEVSSNSTTFSSTAVVAPTSGVVSQTIAVRLASTVVVGPVSGTITNISGSVTATVAVSGTVSAQPTLVATPTTLSSFTATVGTPSVAQSYTLSALNLPGSVTVAAPTGVEVSTIIGGPFSASLTLPQSTTSAVVFARLTGASTGAISGTITNTSGSLSAAMAVSGSVSASAGVIYHDLAAGPLSQDWTNTGLITTNDVWTGVPSIIGYLGDDGSTTTAPYGGGDPQTVIAPLLNSIDMIANQTSTAITSGGVAEFQITNPVVALQGSGTADAPFLLVHLNTTSVTGVRVQYNVRDIDGTADDAIQPVALQYRVGTSGNFINVPAAYIADATTGPSIATLVTAVDVTLPAAVGNQAEVQIRIITINAANSDEWVGIDDIVISSFVPTPTLTANPTSLTGLTYVAGSGPATAPVSVSGTNLTFTGGSGTVTATSSNTALTVSPASTTFNSSSLASTNFTVGLVSGLVVGSAYSASITFAGGGATVVVPVSGTVTAAPNLSINDVTLLEGNSGTTTASFTVTLSAPAPAGGVTFDIATADGTATAGSDYLGQSLTSQTIPAGSSTYVFSVTVNGDVTSEPDETFFVNVTNITGANLVDGQGIGTITNDDATLISTIQGSGTAATAGTFTIEAIVVGVFNGTQQLGGFYVQEEYSDQDGNVLTSEGIFVNSLSAVSVGDRVRIAGNVQETFNQTVITPTPTPTSVQVLASGLQALVTPTTVTLPTAALGDLERYEGMLVNFTQTLTVTETFNLGRFGEVVLANGRLSIPTNSIDPNDNPATGTSSTGTSNVAAITAQQDLNNRSRIILDDASAATNLADVPYIDATNPTLRIGSSLTTLTGILGFGFSAYRIYSTVTPVFTYAAQPSVPTVGGSVKVSAFNVLNYFNGDGAGGGFPTTRGADTPAEFTRQRDKIISALTQLNADVVGLIEIENDGDVPTSAIADLVNGLNASAPGTYTFVSLANTTGTSGTDEIKVAFIYKPTAVTPVGNAVYSNDAAFNTARPPLAQTFRSNANGGIFTPIVNHFKSKGSSSGLPGDADQGDGQGLSNATRKAQATALLSFVSQIQTSSGDNDVMILGDLNAYAEEDPIDILRAGGFTKMSTATESYVFNGETGSLDHALVTSGLAGQVTGQAYWNINADEPTALDYNDNVQTPGTNGEQSSELRNDVTLYAPDAFRSSDHDPVLVGLNLTGTITATLIAASTPVCAGSPVSLTALVANFGASYSYTITNGTNSTSATAQTSASFVTSVTTTVGGAFTLTVSSVSGSTTAVASSNVTVTPRPSAPTYTLTNNGTICIGNALTVTANGCNSGTVSFTVNPAIGSGSVAPGPPAFYVFDATTQPGTYTVCAICKIGDCSSPMALTTVTIAPLPSAMLMASSSVFCSGNSVTLTASGGTNYTFTGPGNLNQQGGTATAVVSTSGTYTVVVANAAGCSNTATVTISQLASGTTFTLPASASTVCEGSSFSLPVTINGSASMYQWYKDGVLLTNQMSATLTLGNVQLSDAGTYSLVINGGCGNTGNSGSTPFILTVNPKPTITLTFPGGTLISPTSLPTIQLPTPGQVLVQASGGASYNWTLVIDRINGFEIRQTSDSPLFTITKPGPYRVTVTNTNGCTRTVEGLIVN